MQRQSSYKVHMNTISNGELSDPLCDNVNRGLTLVRLGKFLEKKMLTDNAQGMMHNDRC